MKIKVTSMFVAVLSAGCWTPDSNVYSLYRSSLLDNGMRAHVATFDADESEKYNRTNCEIARDLFAGQPGVDVKYWCEKGRYRK